MKNYTLGLLIIFSVSAKAEEDMFIPPKEIKCRRGSNDDIYSTKNKHLGDFCCRSVSSVTHHEGNCFYGFYYIYSHTYNLVGEWIKKKDKSPPPFQFLGSDPYVKLNYVPINWIVPILNGFYTLEIESVDGNKVETPIFRKLDSDKVSKGLSFERDSLPIFLRTDKSGCLKIYGSNFATAEIKLKNKDDLFSGVATLSDFNGEAQVVEGDYIMLKGSGHKIRKVVPRSKELKTVGWVELEPYPHTVKELEAMKAKIVYFDPPKKKEK